jgi:hypothetical protein
MNKLTKEEILLELEELNSKNEFQKRYISVNSILDILISNASLSDMYLIEKSTEQVFRYYFNAKSEFEQVKHKMLDEKEGESISLFALALVMNYSPKERIKLFREAMHLEHVDNENTDSLSTRLYIATRLVLNKEDTKKILRTLMAVENSLKFDEDKKLVRDVTLHIVGKTNNIEEIQTTIAALEDIDELSSEEIIEYIDFIYTQTDGNESIKKEPQDRAVLLDELITHINDRYKSNKEENEKLNQFLEKDLGHYSNKTTSMTFVLKREIKK